MFRFTIAYALLVATSIASGGVLNAPQAYLKSEFHATPASALVYHHHEPPPAAATIGYHLAPVAIQHQLPAVGVSAKHIHRSFDGTVSQYSKAVDTPFSSVRKQDTRVSNNVYRPAIAYSPAALVTHVEYDAPGIHYGW